MSCTDATLSIGDLHFPWQQKSKVARVLDIVEETRPARIVQMGDLYDRFSQSRFAKTAGIMTPSKEAERGRALAEQFWCAVHERSPESKLYQLRGNHDARVLKVLLEKAPELEPFLSDKDFYRFPHVETIFDPAEPLLLKGTAYIHGWGQLGYHMRYFLRPVVRAHSHTAGVAFMKLAHRVIYEMDCGYLADPRAVPLKYRPTTVVRWTHTVGWEDSHGPRVILL